MTGRGAHEAHRPAARRDRPLPDRLELHRARVRHVSCSRTSRPATSGGESIGNDFMSYATIGYQGNGPVFSVLNARLRLFSEATFKYRDLATRSCSAPVAAAARAPVARRFDERASRPDDPGRRPRGERVRPPCQRRAPRAAAPGLGPDHLRADVTTRHGLRVPRGHRLRVLRGRQGDPVFYPVDEVAHWSPIPDPLAPWRGMSWLTPVVREINADLAMSGHSRSSSTTRRRRTCSSSTRARSTEAGWRSCASRSVEPRWRGNANKTLLLDQGADVTVIGASSSEMAFTAA
jgi:hypothetical protein